MSALSVLLLLGLSLAAVLCLSPPVVPPPDPNCDVNTSKCYDRLYKYVAIPKPWADAEFFCLEKGGNLASVHSEAELEFLVKLVHATDSKQCYFWIGLHDLHKEGVWMWTDGTKVDYKKWKTGHPNNNAGVEHCVYGHDSLTFNDVTCSNHYPFVCAFPPGCK